jgi:hypothetical protein
MVISFLIGHAPVKKHLNNMDQIDGDPNCRFCKLEIEKAYHIICCYEALACQHYNLFGKFFAECKDISTASIKDLCPFAKDRVNESALKE